LYGEPELYEEEDKPKEVIQSTEKVNMGLQLPVKET
jgi:hypothetical protein